MPTASKIGLLNEEAGDRSALFSPAHESPAKTLTRSGLVKGLVAMAVIALAVAGSYVWYKLRPPRIPPGFVSSNGRIEATEIDLATKYAGRIEQVLVREGDIVDAGQVVARMGH